MTSIYTRHTLFLKKNNNNLQYRMHVFRLLETHTHAPYLIHDTSCILKFENTFNYSLVNKDSRNTFYIYNRMLTWTINEMFQLMIRLRFRSILNIITKISVWSYIQMIVQDIKAEMRLDHLKQKVGLDFIIHQFLS